MNFNKLKVDPRKAIEVIQKLPQEFNKETGSGAGREEAEKDPLSEGLALADKTSDAEKDSPAAPQPDAGIKGITRNLQFAEAIAGEVKELSPATRAFLKQTVGPAAERFKIYSGRFADMAARILGAEGFAVDKHIFIRSDRFKPDTPEGMGLLAHEALHATGRQTGSVGEKEKEARSVEAQATQKAQEGSQPGYGAMGSGDRELALDQAALTPGDVPKALDKKAPLPSGGLRHQQGALQDSGKSAEEGQLLQVLKVELFRRLREEVDMQYKIHNPRIR